MTTKETKSLAGAMHQPLWDYLEGSKNVLIAGCGGGYDFFSGLPIYQALKKAGVNAYMANLSFTAFTEETITDCEFITPNCAIVTAKSQRRTDSGRFTVRDDYWPELALCKWSKDVGGDPDFQVFMIQPTSGVRQVREAYQKIVERLKIDAIILSDGGTDSLMRGDERGLGTPTEDMTKIGRAHV